MAFQLSPGVLVTEKDLTSIIPAVSTSTGGFAGTFVWGPVLEPTTISSENQLVARFGKPVAGNASSFFTAANFLSYSNNMLVVRAEVTGALNSVAVATGSLSGITISDGGDAYTAPVVTISAPDIADGVQAVATAILGTGGTAGQIVGFTISEPGSGYSAAPVVNITDEDGAGFVGNAVVTTAGVKINNQSDYEMTYGSGVGLVGPWAAKYPGALGNSLRVILADFDTFDALPSVYQAEFDGAPSTSTYAENIDGLNDEVHVLVIDEDGLWTGVKGTVLEKFAYMSKASDARKADGANNYYKEVINTNSKYVWWMDHVDTTGSGSAWGVPAAATTFKAAAETSWSLTGGVDSLSAADGDLTEAFALLADSERYDISLVAAGQVSPTVAKYVIEQVAATRKDCIAFVSPVTEDGEMITGASIVDDTIAFRNDTSFNVNSSYGVLDSGFKYQYDRYNDVYRWVPLNGDVAGLCARTDSTNDAWWSPGGLNRGQIKNVVKLSLNPNQSDRDSLYKAGINPVVSFPGQGTVLFGDKTLLSKPSAFDRINVRRLFIVLEKAIATAAKYQLFEFNDGFTRAQFRSLVEPFLRDVQGRRGVTDFRVKCDETNNTGEVIDRNEFVADIFIKPNRAINFITLNFVAARSGISFDEIGA